MSVRRLMLTGAAMGLVAVLLGAVTPPLPEMADALAAAQRTVDTAGPDALVVPAAGALAWLVWAWGCLGLALTAASAVPGLLGGIARQVSQLVLPAGARRGAAVLLGLGLGVAAPLAGVATTVLAVPASAAAPVGGVPDWPAEPSPADPAPVPAAEPDATVPAPVAAAADGATVPDWPDISAPADGSHVVVRGDCLWHIAEAHLLGQPGPPPTEAAIARAVDAWWSANAAVIGADPDLLLPGQVLRPPGGP
jgi:nucleoid-associated protein YgaU